MGITVAVKVEHLEMPKTQLSIPSEQSRIVLVPNVEVYGTVKATVKEFIRCNLFISDELQVLQAPLFRKLSDKDSVEDIYKRYACQVDIENPELHLDEDNFAFFAREGGRSVDVDENMRLEEYHILDKSLLQLRRLPQSLPESGGRIFVETKDGVLPLLGVNGETPVLELKLALQRMTGIPVDQQLLSSVGRIMHDGFFIKDFEGPHRVCEDSTLDLCKSGDSNTDQAHLRMVISVNVMGEQSFTLVVQGRDLVQSVLQVVESRTGVATWQQRITFSGKVLQEKKTLSEYYIHPDCTLQVTIFRSPCKPSLKSVNVIHSRENSGVEEHKPAARKIKLLRTSKGHSNGTITIPVLTTDTISDLRRKVRRTLQPLMERNFVVLRSPLGDSCDNNTTPKVSPSPSKGDQFSTSGRRLSRVLSFTGRTFSGPLTSNGTPTSKAGTPQSNGQAASPSPLAPAEDHKKVARVLSFRNFSGSLSSPSGKQPKHRPVPAAPAPLAPPPLSSPNGSPPGQQIDANGGPFCEIKLTPAAIKVGGDELPALRPMRPNVSATPPKPPGGRGGGHTRAASMGQATHQLYTLPLHPEPSVEQILPHTAPSALGSDDSTPPPPKYAGAKESGVEKPQNAPISVASDNSTPSPPKNGRAKEAGIEKRTLSAWFTDSMHVLKGHIKAPFLER